MGDGTGTESGLIGENTAGHSFFHTQEHTADNTAGNGGRMKCSRNDGSKYGRDALIIHNDYAESEYNIEERHERNEFFGHASDPLDPSKQDKSHHDRDQDAEEQIARGDRILIDDMEIQERGIDRSRDRVDLSGISGAEYGQDAEDGK